MGHVHAPHVLEVRREGGWSDGQAWPPCTTVAVNREPDAQGHADRDDNDGGELVGFESFPGYAIFASAFDDQGSRGAVLARCVRTNANVVIVFPEPDPLD